MDMEKTYWRNSGTHKDLYERLAKLIPAMGGIKGSKNAALERLRKAVNAYYRFYNDGDMFRMGSLYVREPSWRYGDEMTSGMIAIENFMDDCILKAAEEQFGAK